MVWRRRREENFPRGRAQQIPATRLSEKLAGDGKRGKEDCDGEEGERRGDEKRVKGREREERERERKDGGRGRGREEEKTDCDKTRPDQSDRQTHPHRLAVGGCWP